MNNDLISRKALLRIIGSCAESKVHSEGLEAVNNILRIVQVIEMLPAVDAAPVVHAHWIDRDGKTWCSECGASNKAYKPPFCPHCGAMMDKEKENA